ncbi:hypothetical protein PILCRDRAFT_821213 [Piloderma croceum F 1598]|uniref:Cullin family profile domain-containing protein n=1 Tax=Piloderma croceum (strain F 1598) TaxID=765440 RepID=A0A0C3FB14_PILCF|nr:hypothetical protein PILCRDRAFT_821213 [Piloderma croceum F 1598]
MADVVTLLDLPQTSNAFTSLRATVFQVINDGSASPPRKTARLEGDSDSGSASRSRSHVKEPNGSIVTLQIIGESVKSCPDHPTEFTQVRRCIRTLLTRRANETMPITYEAIYSACRSIVCVSNKGEGLYQTLRMELEYSLSRRAKELLDEKCTGSQWIAKFVETCDQFEKQVVLLQSWLTYLDRVYVMHNTKLRNVHDLSFAMFADRIFADPQITERLRSGIHSWVQNERENNPDHGTRPVISSLICHLETHEHYSSVFESYYLLITSDFYAAESLLKSTTVNAQEFLKHCALRGSEEDARSRHVLPESSWGMVKKVTESSLLDGRLTWLAKEAIGVLMKEKKTDGLTKMYGLFARNNGLKILCAHFKAYVQETVQDIVLDTARDDDMVQRLLDFKSFAESTLPTAFADEVQAPLVGTSEQGAMPQKQPNKDFGYALIDAFQTGFKARRNKPAEMIAKYLDKAMRKGQKDASDAAFEALLDSALGLYRFTNDKDVFRTFYHRALAKRLLLERSASNDFEKAMLKKLKEQYDPDFGMGDHMFNDLALSRETMLEFLSKEAADHPSQNLSVMVLQQSVWPFPVRKQDAGLPPSMQDQLTRYATFYKAKHKGHKLDWDHALGTATLKARFNVGPKELSVSLYQSIILLLFNEATELSYTDISGLTGMEDKELRRTLQSLACGNKKVLKKRPVGKDVGDEDVFYFNADFTDPRAKVHINSIQSKETPEESKRAQISIEGDRKHYLDAAIVRIMKARKELSYEQLKAATIDAVKSHFVPEVSVIKQRIAGLVEQEYLSRDDEDMNLYTYVA